MKEVRDIIDRLNQNHELAHEEYVFLLENRNPEDTEYVTGLSGDVARSVYGNRVFLRGLIEFTNYCHNNCYYCGIRCGNVNVSRYRLDIDQIMACCKAGYESGLRTFVLQGGEDPFYTDDEVCRIVSRIRHKYPDCAVTLSIGEKTRASYKRYYDAGADRYLLRHETACDELYGRLHPASMSLDNRKRCLRDLKDIGYQVGAGFMVGAPYQTYDDLASDFEFLKELMPHMIGIGPFIHHKDTPFRDRDDGTLELTVFCLSVLRLMFPEVLLPATTALGTIDPMGREQGILAGANVIMPSLSSDIVKDRYLLYDGKVRTDVAGIEDIRGRLDAIGYEIEYGRGDHTSWSRL